MGNFKRFFGERWKVVLVSAIAVLALTYAGFASERYFSTDKFCTSCHSMTYPAEELKNSKHYGPLGIRPECQDCHLPPQVVPRLKAHIEEGIKDILGEMMHDFSTKEKFNERRAEFAHTSRIILKKLDSAPCRACHSAVHGGLKGKPEEKRENPAVTCIDCHQNLVHERVPEEDLDRGLKEGKIVLK